MSQSYRIKGGTTEEVFQALQEQERGAPLFLDTENQLVWTLLKVHLWMKRYQTLYLLEYQIKKIYWSIPCLNFTGKLPHHSTSAPTDSSILDPSHANCHSSRRVITLPKSTHWGPGQGNGLIYMQKLKVWIAFKWPNASDLALVNTANTGVANGESQWSAVGGGDSWLSRC